jgi:hypothetical protein
MSTGHRRCASQLRCRSGTNGDARQVLTGVSPCEAVIVDAPAGLKDDAPVKAVRS